jgi:hypothetical protein
VSWISQQLREWGCAEPDATSTPEYRALYDTLSRNLRSAEADDASAHVTKVALASLDKFISQAEAVAGSIKIASGAKALPPTCGAELRF